MDEKFVKACFVVLLAWQVVSITIMYGVGGALVFGLTGIVVAVPLLYAGLITSTTALTAVYALAASGAMFGVYSGIKNVVEVIP
jgi:hypothetical protein